MLFFDVTFFAFWSRFWWFGGPKMEPKSLKIAKNVVRVWSPNDFLAFQVTIIFSNGVLEASRLDF